MSLLPNRIINQLDNAFCGRADVLNSFRMMLNQPAPPILCLSGQDGIGKSWLLYQMAREAEKKQALVVLLTKEVKQPLDFMEAVSNQLAAQGKTLKEFNDLLKIYHQTRQEALKGMQIPFGFYSLAGGVPERNTPQSDAQQVDGEDSSAYQDQDIKEESETTNTDQMPDQTPNEGAFKKQKQGPVEEKALDIQSIDQALGTIENFGMAYLSWKINDLEKTLLVVHPEEVLARTFLSDLQKTVIGTPLLILVDDYEHNRSTLEAWLKRVFSGELGKLPGWLFVFTSREKIPENSWRYTTVHYPLRPFNQQEMQEFLNRKKISDTRRQNAIQSLSGGIPVLLGFLTSEPAPAKKQKEVYPEKLIDAFFAWSLPEEMQAAILNAAVPRRLDREIMEQAAGAAGGQLYEWLQKQSYMVEQDGGIAFHPFIRTRLVQKKFSEDLAGWCEIHNRMHSHFSDQLPKTAIDENSFWNDKQKQQAAQEAVYHQLCANRPKNLTEALSTYLDLLEFDPELASGWATSIRQAGADTMNRGLFNWGQRLLTGLSGLNQKNYPAANSMFTALAQYPGLDPDHLAVVTRWRAEVQRCLFHHAEALTLLEECLAGDPENDILYALQGEINRTLGDYEKAVNDFRRALQINPDCAYSLSRRGEIFREMALYEDALKDLNQALELAPNAAGLLALRADILRHIKRLPDAMDDLNHALVMKPQLTIALAGRGDLYLLNGKLEEALRDFEGALELRPDWGWAIASRGATYQKMGFNDFAIQDFSRALEMNDRYASVLVKRATVYRQIEHYEEALDDLNRAIILMPNDPTLYAIRGELYQHTGNYEESLSDFNQAIELDPNFVGGIAARGATYRRMAQYTEALLDFSRAAELDPGLVAVVANQGEIYRKLGKYEEALECFSRAIEYKPDYVWAIAGRGETYRKMKRYHDALVDFDRVVELEPENPRGYASRGMTYRLMEQYDRALQDFNLAIGFDPNYHGALALRGETHRRLKNLVRAIKDFSRALQIKPDNWTFSGRGEALFQIARYNEALADFNQALVMYQRDTWAITWRARTYQKIKRYSKALQDYSLVIDFDPNDDELRMTRAFLFQYTGNEANAYTDFEKAIEIGQAKYEANPMDISNILHLTIYHLALGNFDQTDALFDEALAGQLTQETLEEILEHLADFQYVFPDHKRAYLLQQKLLKKRTAVNTGSGGAEGV